MSLSTYLTGIADAIREKKGTSEPINAQDFATEIKGIETSENLDAELTAQDEAITSLETAVDKLPEPKADRLQWKCDNMKSLVYEFNGYTGESLDDVLAGLDTSQVTNMSQIFQGCTNLNNLPQLDTSNVTNMTSMFERCTNLTTIPELDTSKVTTIRYAFQNCYNLTTIPLLDMISVLSSSNTSQMFYYCYKLTNLTLKNIKYSVQIGSGSTYGHLLTDESLINTAKELWDKTGSTSQTLTLSTPSLARFSEIYVKLVDVTDDMIANDEYITNKKPCVVCASTDAGAMTIQEYVTLKNWQLA